MYPISTPTFQYVDSSSPLNNWRLKYRDRKEKFCKICIRFGSRGPKTECLRKLTHTHREQVRVRVRDIERERDGGE